MHRYARYQHEGSPAGAVDTAAEARPGRRTGSGLLVQRRATGSPSRDAAVAGPESGGITLPEGLGTRLGAALGADLGGVRVHTGAASHAAAHALGARAYAVGQDIHFGQGEYTPGTPAGDHLIAHEVAHTVQQGGGARPQTKLAVSQPGDACEREADAFADGFARGDSVAVTRGAAIAAMTKRYAVDWGGNAWESDGVSLVDDDSFLSIDGSWGVRSDKQNLVAGFQPEVLQLVTLDNDSKGVVAISSWGDYELDEGINNVGSFHIFAEWGFTCDTDGTITLEPGVSHVAKVIPDEVRGRFEVKHHLDGAGGPIVQLDYAFKGPVSGRKKGHTFIQPTFRVQLAPRTRAAIKPPAPSTGGGGGAAAGSFGYASASASVSVPAPAPVTVPPRHSIYFANEKQTTGDAAELVAWAASLPESVQSAIRSKRLSVTVLGFASTTGDAETNFEVYSAQRAAWVRRVLAPALGMAVGELHVGHRGEYTAPPADQTRKGVANPKERRADIIFEETNPMTTATATSNASAVAGAAATAGKTP